MECDKNMGLINQKSWVELPCQWNEVILNARRHPFPFEVIYRENQALFYS